MSNSNFDHYSESYGTHMAASLRIGGEESDYYIRYKILDAKRYAAPSLDANTAPPLQILDFGAGTGTAIPHWCSIFADAKLTCCDVSERSLELARSRHGGDITYAHTSETDLPFQTGSFDLVYAACVFHHIPENQHLLVMRELWRVLKPGGALMIYEHNPLNPLTQAVVRSCPFDEDAVLIWPSVMMKLLRDSGFSERTSRYRIFFPKVLRRLRWLEAWLGWLPLGAQYFSLGWKSTRSC
ncbi:MAG: class I SAM-dependent methyltransferase [Cyanobacteriota bacterium]|nr:class I SAM-dependent methyltransferase [Cyanobacteriota bacterium]